MLEKPPKILEVANVERMTFRKANRSAGESHLCGKILIDESKPPHLIDLREKLQLKT